MDLKGKSRGGGETDKWRGRKAGEWDKMSCGWESKTGTREGSLITQDQIKLARGAAPEYLLLILCFGPPEEATV